MEIILYADEERRLSVVTIPEKELVLERQDGKWKPTTTKGVTLEAIQGNVHGFYNRRRTLSPSESYYQEVVSSLA